MWKPGDEPEAHPDWEKQVALELEMLQRGAERFRGQVARAREREQMTRVKPIRRLMDSLVEDTGLGIEAWLKGAAKRRGVVPLAHHTLKDRDPFVVAYIGIQTVLDRITIDRVDLLDVAQDIGIGIEYEARMAAWLAVKPDLFHTIQDGLARDRATDVHRKRVNINRFNELVREEIGWVDWSRDERRHTGLKVLDLMIRRTQRFEVVQDVSKGRPNKKAPYIIRPTDDLMQWLVEAIENAEVAFPMYMPTVMPPKRWEGVRKGGFYTPILRTPKLIRFKAHNEEAQGWALEEYDALDMPATYSALHHIQETPWRINERVLDVALECWERDLGVAGIMRQEPRPLPPQPADAETNPEALKLWKRAASRVYGENKRRLGVMRSIKTTLDLATKARHEDAIYFPHMLDFRGRMYPIPVYLQPQGHDLARGLLTFKEGRPITFENGGAGWLAVHLANTWGNDKVSFDERIDWVEEREELWRRIASDPIAHLEWATEADSPWQALAAVFEWVRFLDEGFGMVSSLPIRVDGTCNGIQHLSAMLRDEIGGASVNLVPGDKPRDIYQEVADRVHERLTIISKGGGTQGALADLWLEGFDGRVPRALTKRPVMVMPYGGTKDAYFQYIWAWLNEVDPEHTRFPEEHLRLMVPFLKDILWDEINGTVKAGAKVMRWLQECAKKLAVSDQPIVWTTPAGFVVRHFYGTLKGRKIETKVDGKSLHLMYWDHTKTLSAKDQVQGISPNFVHSQDASALTLCINDFAGAEAHRPITAIHDAYGTVAGLMWDLHRSLREAFVTNHSEDVLYGFRDTCVRMYAEYLMATREDGDEEAAYLQANREMPSVPMMGKLDLTLVNDSKYFFA